MSTANCVSCEHVSVEADSVRDTTLIVNLPCCRATAFSWYRRDTVDAHAVDEFGMWDDGLVWDDSTLMYDSPLFTVSITCVPLGFPACFYETDDGLAYTTSDYYLYAACDADGG